MTEEDKPLGIPVKNVTPSRREIHDNTIRQDKPNNKKWVIGVSIVVLLVLVIGYCFGISYYSDRFLPNTVINDINVSGLTVEDAQQQLVSQINKTEVDIQENGESIGTITLEAMRAEFDISQPLTELYEHQNPNGWLFNYVSGDDTTVSSGDIAVSQSDMVEQIVALGVNNNGRDESQDAYIDYNKEQRYFVVDEVIGNQVNVTEIRKGIEQALVDNTNTIDLSNYYLAPTITSDSEEITQTMNHINDVANTKITVNVAGHEETISQEYIYDWMGFDGSNLTVDYQGIYDWLGILNDKYATYGKSTQFESTMQGTVNVPAGTRSWSINREQEASYIKEQLEAATDSNEEPFIDGSGYGQASSVGSDYIEVDLSNQKMFVYIDGVQVVNTDIVSGQVGTDTVPGMYQVWDKQSPSNLTGYNPRTQQDYVQPVDYWLPFDDTGQGIHDANWQSSFGGNTYQVSGSLGCINTPPGIMDDVFNYAYVGIPVVVFE